MVGSIQLLRKRGSLPYFINVSTIIQNVTQRKFNYAHLAQLKHIFSESIVINKVSVRDEVTCCMKPELQIALQVEAVGEDMRQKAETGYTALMRVFKERLVDFSNKHPQGDDVPEEMLPHPFNQTRVVLPPKIETIPLQLVSAETPQIVSSHAQFAGLSHVPPSFKPFFSRRKVPCEQKTKSVPTPKRLMTRTPEIQTLKRSRLDAGCDSPRPMKSEKRSTRTKLFSTLKNEKMEDDVSELACSYADLSLLPKQLLKSIKGKERKALEEREAGRRQLLSRLPSMFDTILLIFQSTQRSTMTKQELIHKIITSNLKIVDKDEAEEQLKLLQELVPDYIFEKLALSGDTLCCVNKMLCPEEVLQRLAEAVRSYVQKSFVEDCQKLFKRSLQIV